MLYNIPTVKYLNEQKRLRLCHYERVLLTGIKLWFKGHDRTGVLVLLVSFYKKRSSWSKVQQFFRIALREFSETALKIPLITLMISENFARHLYLIDEFVCTLRRADHSFKHLKFRLSASCEPLLWWQHTIYRRWSCYPTVTLPLCPPTYPPNVTLY